VAGILGDWVALIAEIKRRAQHRALEREEDASKRTSAILAEANERRATMLRRLEQESELELAAMIRRNSAKGELEARRRFTILREQPIDQVWQDAEARLRALVAQPEYLDVLQRLALLAARELGPGEFVLSGDPVGHSLHARGAETVVREGASEICLRAASCGCLGRTAGYQRAQPVRCDLPHTARRSTPHHARTRV